MRLAEDFADTAPVSPTDSKRPSICLGPHNIDALGGKFSIAAASRGE